MSWEPINLTASEFDKPSLPPSLCGLVYAGKRHVLSGPPEALKTLLVLILALEHMRAGGTIAFVDFESGPAETRRLLEDLGATRDEVASVFYFEPDGPPATEDIERIVNEGVTLVVIDAAAGAYDVSELDDNKRADAERFAAAWIRPLWQRGVTTIVIDHVTKNTGTRGRFAIGSERKLGQADVHLGLHAVKQLSRGTTGLVTVHTHKDRPGHLTRPKAAEVELQSAPESHRITWTIRPANEHSSEDGGWRPTVLMERVSLYLEQQTDAVSRNNVEKNVKGTGEYLRVAMDVLVAEGYAAETRGPRDARELQSLRTFRDTTSSSSDFVGTSSETRTTTSSSSSPSKGDEDEVDEHLIERLLVDHADIAEVTT